MWAPPQFSSSTIAPDNNTSRGYPATELAVAPEEGVQGSRRRRNACDYAADDACLGDADRENIANAFKLVLIANTFNSYRRSSSIYTSR
jgi:hypothetical protein